MVTVCDLLDAHTALAACCGFDQCHKYILYLYVYFVFIGIVIGIVRAHPRGARSLWTYLWQLVSALGHLHSRRILHRDGACG